MIHGLDHEVEIILRYKEEILNQHPHDPYGTPPEPMSVIRTEFRRVPLRVILESIIETLIADLVQFTNTLEGFRSLQNIPVGIGVDSKLPNYRVSFYLGRTGSLRVDLKNFDNEPPNLKIFNNGKPLYRGGPLYDRISELFPGCHLQDDFVDRVQKITAFRSLLKKLLASIAADYFKYQQETSMDFQWFIDLVNREVSSQEMNETPVGWPEIDEYMQKSKKAHRAFRLYVWVCQLTATLVPGRLSMPAAYIPVDHEQKTWLDAVQKKYREVIAGLILLNQFDELDRLLQVILTEQINFPSPQPLAPSSEMNWLSFYLMRMQHMLVATGAYFISWLDQAHHGVPVLSALETIVNDFVHSSPASVEAELAGGYDFYCNWAQLPVLNHPEHVVLHNWWEIWRWVRLQCGLTAGEAHTNPLSLSPGQSMRDALQHLQEMWRGHLQLSQFVAPQPAVARLFGLSQDRVRALIHRLLQNGRASEMPGATMQLSSLQQWFAVNEASSSTGYYQHLAYFSGFFLNAPIHIFEFVDGLLTGITVVGMRFDSSGDFVGYENFIPQESVNFSQFAEAPQRQSYFLFHNQSSSLFSDEEFWYSVGVPMDVPPTNPDGPEVPGLMDIPDTQFHIDPAQLNQPGTHNPQLIQTYIDKLNTLLMASRFRVVGVATDNSCLFHAIAYAVSAALGSNITAADVKRAIKKLLARLKLKVQLNFGAIDNAAPGVVEPYTEEELFLLGFLGGALDLLEAELNVEGVWNDYTMIILAANAFHTPLTFIAPPVTPITIPENAEPNVLQVNPGHEPTPQQQLPHGPVIFFNGTVHWDVAIPVDEVSGGELLATVFSNDLQEKGLAATLAIIQMHLGQNGVSK